MVSYSDGEGSYAQVGIALWAQGQKMARAGVVRIPDDLRTRWDSKRKGNRYNDIFEVEAVGPLLVLTNFGEDLVDCLWLHTHLSRKFFARTSHMCLHHIVARGTLS